MSGDARAFLQQDNQVPWGQLVHYVFRKSDLWWPDLDDHYQILPRLENVEICVLDSSVPISRNPILPLRNTLVLCHLHTLVLAHAEEDEKEAIAPLLRWLTLPALRILRFPLGFDCPDALVEFLNRSNCSLEELTIVEIESELMDAMHDMIRVLEVPCLQKLHTLGLGGSSWQSEKEKTAWDAIFKALTCSQHSDRLLLPELRRLMLYGFSMTWTDGTLVNMILSRREGVEGWNTCLLEKVILWDVGHWDDRMDEASKGEMDQVLALRQDDFSLRVVRDERIDWYEIGESQQILPLEEAIVALSRSNEPPSPPLLCEDIRKRYVEASECIATIDLQIKEILGSLTALQEARHRKAENKQLYASLLHPIRRLPPEILSEIFRLCTFDGVQDVTFCYDDDAEHRRFPGSLNTHRAPWVLGQVCRTWRFVALSTSELWASINLAWLHTPGDASDSLKLLLELQLQRSRNTPLAISLHTGISPKEYAEREFLLSLICSQISRWEKASIQGDVDGFAPLRPYRKLFPSLKTLHLSLIYNSLWETNPLPVFENSPLLRRFVMGGSADLFQSEDQLPWRQLTHFVSRESEYWFPSLGEHYLILPKLSNVEVLVLDIEFSDGDGAPPSLHPTLEFQYLHTLVLVHKLDPRFEEDKPGIKQLLDWLILPALRILRLPGGFDCPASLIDFSNRSRCSLEELAILDVEYNVTTAPTYPNVLVELLKADALQTLHTLQLGDVKWAHEHEGQELLDTFFRALTAGSTGLIILPKLRHVVLHRPKMAWDDGAFIEMVASRGHVQTGPDLISHGAYQLEEVTFWNLGEEGTSHLDGLSRRSQMMELCSTGLICNSYWGELDWYTVQ
ncbi:hypothetical protein PQX77_011249 [Marasmius sp. AFHP31]|nr:hypothetical protein PQX77_011249 [Marasmius sp. AFHP31]